jgi:hypothetical protein
MTRKLPCPKCGSEFVEPVKFSWWGGVLGPKILSLTKCMTCGAKFNGKTGADATGGIITYCIVTGVIAFVIFFLIFSAL